MDEVLGERKAELRDQHQQQLKKIQDEHNTQLNKLRAEYAEKVWFLLLVPQNVNILPLL